MALLKEMQFTLEMDRPVDVNRHFVSPGGYEMGGKQFDFANYEGYIVDGNKIRYRCYEPEDYMEQIEEADIGPFDEFYLNTGEHNDAEIYPVSVSDLTFVFEDKVIEADERILVSVNRLITDSTISDARLAEKLMEEAARLGGNVYTVYAYNEEVDFIACSGATSMRKAKELTKKWIREFSPGEEEDTMEYYEYRMVITALNVIGTEVDRIMHKEIPDIRKWLEG